MASTLYVPSFVDVLDVTNLALDMGAAGNKIAMFTSSLTINAVTDSDFTAAPYTTNQVSSAGYTAGGNVIASPTWVGSGTPTKIVYDFADPQWTGVTLTARYGILYADALAGNNVYYCIDFVTDFTATAGTFTIQLDAAGLFQWNL
jgi:hypothetical protein